MATARRDSRDGNAFSIEAPLAHAMGIAVLVTIAGCGASAPTPTRAPSPPLVEEEEAPIERIASAARPPLSAEGLGFEPGSEVIRGTATPAVERLAASIGTEDAGPLVRVTVTVDPDPRLCSGVTLARSRAVALRDALIAHGVPAKRIAIEASTGATTDCHAVGATRASIRVAFVE